MEMFEIGQGLSTQSLNPCSCFLALCAPELSPRALSPSARFSLKPQLHPQFDLGCLAEQGKVSPLCHSLEPGSVQGTLPC